MNWVHAGFAYFLIWWTVIFMVLPWGVRRDAESENIGGDAGAPTNPNLKKKFLWTSLVALIVWACYVSVAIFDIITFDMIFGVETSL